MSKLRLGLGLMALACLVAPARGQSIPEKLAHWLVPQNWEKQKDGPVISLGESGAFDDMHIFAPFVVLENGRYSLLYPGSRGTVPERVYRLGLATSEDGVHFTKKPGGPVYEVGDGRHSVVTPVLLRETDGTPIREKGKLRMWFTAVDFYTGRHTLHEATGEALDRSKAQEGKSCITVLGETRAWDRWESAWERAKGFTGELDAVPTAALYRLLAYGEMWRRWRDRRDPLAASKLEHTLRPGT